MTLFATKTHRTNPRDVASAALLIYATVQFFLLVAAPEALKSIVIAQFFWGPACLLIGVGRVRAAWRGERPDDDNEALALGGIVILALITRAVIV
jgi:hypothetical protein